MAWFLGILKFLSMAAGVWSLLMFVIVCIASVIAPDYAVEDGKVVDSYGKAKYILTIICAVAFGLFVALV